MLISVFVIKHLKLLQVEYVRYVDFGDIWCIVPVVIYTTVSVSTYCTIGVSIQEANISILSTLFFFLFFAFYN